MSSFLCVGGRGLGGEAGLRRHHALYQSTHPSVHVFNKYFLSAYAFFSGYSVNEIIEGLLFKALHTKERDKQYNLNSL